MEEKINEWHRYHDIYKYTYFIVYFIHEISRNYSIRVTYVWLSRSCFANAFIGSAAMEYLSPSCLDLEPLAERERKTGKEENKKGRARYRLILLLAWATESRRATTRSLSESTSARGFFLGRAEWRFLCRSTWRAKQVETGVQSIKLESI